MLEARKVIFGELLPADRVVGSYFSEHCILSVVRFVRDGAISMRAASRIKSISDELMGQAGDEAPTHTTIQNFLLRIGLYVLQCLAQRQRDWIWMADHTHSVGTTKCFVVVGIRLSFFLQLRRPLQHEDLVVLELIPVDGSNGEIVCGQLTTLCVNYGVPLAILSDRGSDLNKGVRLLQKSYPDVIALYDIAHMVARLTESTLTNEAQWSEYNIASCVCAHAVRQGKLSHLKPPRTKTKARYMNIRQEIRWGARALQILDRVRSDKLNDRQRERLPKADVEAKLGWLETYRESLNVWEKVTLMGQESIKVIRKEGYGMAALTQLRDKLGEPEDAVCREFSKKLMDECTQQCKMASQYESLPGTSEILESLFGKAKRLLGGNSTGSTNSLTSQLLAMVTCTVQITAELIREGLAICRIKNLIKWREERFPPGTHWARRNDLRPTHEEQKLRKQQNTTIPNF